MKNKTGYKIKFDPEIYRLLRDTGTSHTLSVKIGKFKKPLRFVRFEITVDGIFYTFEYASSYHKWKQIVVNKDGDVVDRKDLEVTLEWETSLLENYV